MISRPTPFFLTKHLISCGQWRRSDPSHLDGSRHRKCQDVARTYGFHEERWLECGRRLPSLKIYALMYSHFTYLVSSVWSIKPSIPRQNLTPFPSIPISRDRPVEVSSLSILSQPFVDRSRRTTTSMHTSALSETQTLPKWPLSSRVVWVLCARRSPWSQLCQCGASKF